MANKQVDKTFLFDSLFFYSTVVFLYIDSPLLKEPNLKHPSTQLLVYTLIIVGFVNHVAAFGAKQFVFIPRAIGGGKPELAMIKLSTTNAALAGFLSGTTNNSGIIGPEAVLLRTDKGIIFVDAKDLDKTDKQFAKQMRMDLIEAISYTQMRNSP